MTIEYILKEIEAVCSGINQFSQKNKDWALGYLQGRNENRFSEIEFELCFQILDMIFSKEKLPTGKELEEIYEEQFQRVILGYKTM